jgi:hypothetical protein
MSNLLLLVVLCLGLLLWRGMARLRVPIDGFILALVFVLLAALAGRWGSIGRGRGRAAVLRIAEIHGQRRADCKCPGVWRGPRAVAVTNHGVSPDAIAGLHLARPILRSRRATGGASCGARTSGRQEPRVAPRHWPRQQPELRTIQAVNKVLGSLSAFPPILVGPAL